MEELKSLVKVTSKHKIKNINIISKEAHSGESKIYQLFKGIVEEKFKDDEQAMEALYEDDTDGNKRAAYRKLKQRLEKRLHNTLFFIDANEARFKNTQKAYYYCYKQLSTVKILIGRGARKAAIPLAEKTLRKAMKFEITQVVVELATDLRNHYAVNGKTMTLCKKYDKIIEDYSRLRRAEQLAEKLYSYLMARATRKRSSDAELAKDASHYSRLLERKHQQLSIRTYRFSQLYFMVKILQYEIQGNQRLAIQACREAIQYFKDSEEANLQSFAFTFTFKLLQVQIQAERYEEAELTVDSCEQLLIREERKTSTDWLQVQYCKVLIYFHTENYGEAYRVYEDTQKHELYDQQNPQARERWRIVDAYLHYLITIHKVAPDESWESQNFRLARFLNELPIFSKDKFGYNIDLITLNILFLLHRKTFSKIIDRMESWKSYTTRLSKKNRKSRGHYFLRMLLCLPKANFHPRAVERHAAEWEARLQRSSVDKQLEIIPYEKLWEFIIESLEQ